MAHFKSSETFDTFFEAEVKLSSVTGFNKTEQVDTAHIQGATGLLAVNEILQYCRNSGTDFRNLGRWSWYLLYSTPEFWTRVISAYSVGQRVTEGEGRVYQQHLREIMRNESIPLETTPYELFCNDLIQQLQTWVAQGDRIILMMDANEHVLNGTLCRRMRDEELGLDLEETSHKKVWGGQEINTHIDGSKPIDGV